MSGSIPPVVEKGNGPVAKHCCREPGAGIESGQPPVFFMNEQANRHDLSGNDYAALGLACVAAVVIAFLPAAIVQAVAGVPLPASLLGVAAVVGVAYFRAMKAGR